MSSSEYDTQLSWQNYYFGTCGCAGSWLADLIILYWQVFWIYSQVATMALQCYTPLLKPQLGQVSVNPSINTVQVPGLLCLARTRSMTSRWNMYRITCVDVWMHWPAISYSNTLLIIIFSEYTRNNGLTESVLRPSAEALTGPSLGQPFSKSMQIADLPCTNMLLA